MDEINHLSNAESGMAIDCNAAILDESIHSMVQSKTNPKVSFAVHSKGDIISDHAKSTYHG